MNSHDISTTYISHNIHRKTGWGVTEYDEFDTPFQWIGRHATISVQLNSASNILYIYAGSPDFPGNRNISISASNIDQSQQISPGWKAYQFDLSPVSQAGNSVLEITISIDHLLDIREDSRDLGIMVREIHCNDHVISSVEISVNDSQRNIERRIDYYSSSRAPGILWLASFPRSGNTWMRFLLTNLLFETVHESKIISEYVDDIIDPFCSRRQAHNRKISLFGSKAAHVIKTHIPFTFSMPLKEQTIGAIYMLRNPLDIAVSLRKFRGNDTTEFLNYFLTYGIETDTHLLDYESWHGHVFSWLQAAESSRSFPVMLIKYEDLVAEPFATCTRVLDWLQVARSADHIRQAIEQSSIGNLRKMESVETEKEIPGIFFTLEQKSEIKTGRRFLADGKSDNYRNYLTESEIRKGLATFGPIMKELNYI